MFEPFNRYVVLILIGAGLACGLCRGQQQETLGPESPAHSPGVEEKAFQQALGKARQSLADSNLPGARRALKTAEKYAQSRDDKMQLERLESLTGNVEEFWKTMSRIVGSMEAMEEIALGEDRLIVVEVNPNLLAVKVRGCVRQYSPIQRIPYVLVASLADQRFGKNPQSQAIYASYLGTCANGDRRRAKRLFQEAIAAGVDVSDLLPEIDLMPTELGKSEGQESESASESEADQKAEQAVRERFRDDYKAAKTAAEKAQLARKLLKASQSTDEEPAASLVILREARKLAVAGGDAELACTVIDDIAQIHGGDDLAMKQEALEEILKAVRPMSAYKGVAQSALPLIEAAVSFSRPEEARRLAEIALTAAQKSRNPSLIKQVRAAIQERDIPLKGGKRAAADEGN